MDRFNHHHNALRLQFTVVEQLRDLSGQALLNLQAAGEDISYASELGEPDDATVFRYIGYMHDPAEGCEVVFAERVERNIFDHNYIIVCFCSYDLDLRCRVLMQPPADLRIHFRDAARRIDQAGTRDVFAYTFENQTSARCDLLQVYLLL